MNKKIPKSLPTIVLVFALALITSYSWAEFTAEINSNSVAINDAFQLTLSSDDVSFQSTPDLTPLEQNFKILGMSQSLQTHIVNGHTSRKHNWIITLSPKVAGQLIIPTINLSTSQGIESTAPISVQVIEQDKIASQNDQTISITANVTNKNSHYIFQEIPLTVHIETTQTLVQAELIVSDIPNVEIEQSVEDKTSQIMRNGQPVTVIERQYILHPQKTGKLEIPSIIVRGKFRGKVSNRHSQFAQQFGQSFDPMFDEMFDSMFDDMVARNGVNSIGKEFVVKTKPIILDIKANPNGQDEWFLPAKAVELFSEWQDNGTKISNPTFKVGEPITRQISLVAVGAKPEQLPKLEIADVEGVHFYIDDDKTEKAFSNAKGIIARRVLNVSVVPEHSGEFVLPEIKVKWLNTATDEAETAILPAETIKVLGANGTFDGSGNDSVNNNSDNNSSDNNSSNTIAKSDNNSKNSKTENSQIDTDDNKFNKNKVLTMSKWGGLGLLLITLLLIVSYIYRNKKTLSQSDDKAQSDSAIRLAKAKNDIQQIINDKNFENRNLDDTSIKRLYQALYQALINYKQLKATSQPLDKSLEEVLQKLENRLYANLNSTPTQPPTKGEELPSLREGLGEGASNNISKSQDELLAIKKSVKLILADNDGKLTDKKGDSLPNLYPN